MNRGKTNLTELFYLMLMFELGSAIIFGLGFDAGRDAWIAILFAMISSFPFIFIYVRLYTVNKMSFEGILEELLGKFLGRITVFFYISYFIYMSAVVTRNFTEFSALTISPKAPPLFDAIGIIFLSSFYLLYNFNVIAKVSKLTFPMVIFSILFVYIVLTFTRFFDISQILPIMENGILPVIKAAIPITIVFPFCDMIVFLTLFHELNDMKGLYKYTFLAVIITGIILALDTIFAISVFGPEKSAKLNLPFYILTRMIYFGNFKNLDAIYVIVMSIGIFFKVIVYMYASLNLLKEITKSAN